MSEVFSVYRVVELSLATTGAIAVSIWIAKWILAFVEKQRILADTEKTTREALRDALTAEQALRSAKEQSYSFEIEQLKKRLSTLRKVPAANASELSQLEKFKKIVDASSQMTVEVARMHSQRAIDKTSEVLTRLVGLTLAKNGTEIGKFGDIFARAFNDLPEPDGASERILYNVCVIVEVVYKLKEQLLTISSIVPTLMEEHFKDSGASFEQLVLRWGNRLMKGDLYEDVRARKGLLGSLEAPENRA